MRVSLNRFVELISTAPAKASGLFPRKGTTADVVFVDPERKETISINTPCSLHVSVDCSAHQGSR